MIICDIISWIWRYLIYCQVLGVIGGDELECLTLPWVHWHPGRHFFDDPQVLPEFWFNQNFRHEWHLSVHSTHSWPFGHFAENDFYWLPIEFHAPEVCYKRIEIRQTWAEFMFTPMYFHSFFGTSGGVVAKGGTATSASTRTRLRAFIIETWSKAILFPVNPVILSAIGSPKLGKWVKMQTYSR